MSPLPFFTIFTSYLHSGETDEAVGFIRYGRRRSDRIRTARFVW